MDSRTDDELRKAERQHQARANVLQSSAASEQRAADRIRKELDRRKRAARAAGVAA